MEIKAANGVTNLTEAIEQSLYKLANLNIRESHRAAFIGMSSWCQPIWVSPCTFLESFVDVYSHLSD